jgi:hypothetical protein
MKTIRHLLIPAILAGGLCPLVGQPTLRQGRSCLELSIGGRISAGADLFTSGTFSIGLRAGFLLMADIAQAVGARKNFSGPDFSLGAAFFWGAARTTRAGD